jgi:hypothetical protein
MSIAGLDAVAEAWERLAGEKVTTDEVAYLVRQVHTTIGCQHGCTHCFASPPLQRTTMAVGGFARLADEFGEVARRTRQAYEFLFLGSATDPSSIPDFAVYLATWIDALPAWSPSRLYTHGWLVDDVGQQAELRATQRVLAQRVQRIEMVNVSIDTYSRLARDDPDAYVVNVAANVRALTDAVGIDKVRLHILYPVARVSANAATLLWEVTPGQSVRAACTALERYHEPADRACAALTVTVLRIGAAAGLSVEETVARSRDAGIPMPAGRGTRLFRGAPESAREEGLAWYRRKALPRVDDTVGLQIYPNGTVQVVDYDGYRAGPWLDDGARVVGYLEVAE